MASGRTRVLILAPPVNLADTVKAVSHVYLAVTILNWHQTSGATQAQITGLLFTCTATTA